MSKKDLIDAMADAAEITKDKAGTALEAVIKHIEKSMKKGEEVRIPGFGTFKVTKRAAREAWFPAPTRSASTRPPRCRSSPRRKP